MQAHNAPEPNNSTSVVLQVDQDRGIQRVKIYGYDRDAGFRFYDQLAPFLQNLDRAARQAADT